MPRFEALPEDILVRIVCCVEHDDLKQLFHVSKKIREVVILAKRLHFDSSTPASSKFREAPDAPKKARGQQHRSRYDSKRHAEISIDLFAKMEI